MHDKVIDNLDFCIECGEDIQIKEKKIFICQDSREKSFFTHIGDCWDNYKKYLYSFESRKEGPLLGLCEICLKPIRQFQAHEIGRYFISGMVEDEVRTIFPSLNNGDRVIMVHSECSYNS